MSSINSSVHKSAYWFLLLACPVAQAVAESGKQWLEKMVDAMNSRSYTGAFVYVSNNKIEAMKIDRRNSSAGISERLVSLNGGLREIVRNNSVVTCTWPDARMAVIDRSGIKNHFPAKLPENLEVLQEYYTIDVAGDYRVADRSCKLVDIIPKDEYRYGYRVCVDQDSKLMMMSIVMDENRQPIEHVMFTNLEVERGAVPDEPLKPRYSSEGFNVHVQQERKSSESEAGIAYLEPGKLPAGFTQVNAYQKHTGSDNKTVTHFVYSDGMATISVFVEKHSGEEKMPQGNSRMGVVHVYGKHVNDFHVTVVGEVPQATVNAIGELIQPVPPAPAPDH